MKKTKLTRIGLLIITLNILLIVNSVTANSYFLGKIFSADGIGEVSADEKYWNVNGSYQVTNEFSASYSLENSLWSCCPKTKSGAICQDLNSDSIGECSTSALPASCEYVTGCEPGCCIDEKEGLCSSGSTQAVCEQNGGKWEKDAGCNINECQKGCCMFGGKASFMTEQRCAKLSLSYGFEKDFRDVNTEIKCLAIAESQKEGACTFDNGVCKFGTQEECKTFGGKFSEKILCSNPLLGTNCEKQASAGCVDGKDGIYWFDSCGNRENIYSSDKIKSWNDGKVLSQSESCNPSSDNIESSDCGNCNVFLGSRCENSNGNYICKDLNCVDDEGIQRKNGESWCVYDSFIGEGKDPVGSRHWKKMCVEGEVITEPCADYRGQICVQATIGELEGRNVTTAQCVINEAVRCLKLSAGECTSNKACMVKSVNVDEGFKFDVCVGKYPRGFDLSRESDVKSSSQLCSMADNECKVLYVKDWKGKWNCKRNCQCEKSSAFANQMNDLCVSLGDCGSYINYVGEGTNNIGVTNSPGLSWEQYADYANPVEGQSAEPQSIDYTLKQMSGNSAGGSSENNGEESSGLGNAVEIMGTVVGASAPILQSTAIGILYSQTNVGILELAKGIILKETVSMEVAGEAGEVATTTIISEGSVVGEGMAPALGAIGTVASAAGIGMMVGAIGAWAFGVEGQPAYFAQIVGAVVGGGVAAYLSYSGATIGTMTSGGAGSIASFGGAFTSFGGFATLMAAAVWAIIAVVVIMVYTKLIGWGDTKEVIVKFNCYQWQPPVGGENCAKCNEDETKPCSEYRCLSLGTACDFINDGTENPACVKIEDDGKPPVISPGEIMTGFSFLNPSADKVEIKKTNGECIPEFTHVLFTLQTDEYSYCKFDYSRGTGSLDGMQGFFAEETAYTKNHTSTVMMPSVESLDSTDSPVNLTEFYANMNVFVKCQDIYGTSNTKEYEVNFCVKSGPDTTPPEIVLSNLQDENYIGYGLSDVAAVFYVNEPAECKWSHMDRDYTLMENNMTCDNDLIHYNTFGWLCTTTIGNLNEKENNIYVRCKDKPWMVNDTITEINETINETSGEKMNITTIKYRNVNSESFVYNLRKVNEQLEIMSITPDEVSAGFEPVSVELKVKTAKGAESGKANCYYGFSPGEEIRFYTTGGTTHFQTFNSMLSGDYDLYITCKDPSGNVVVTSTNLRVYIDTKPPTVVRTYHDGNNLIVLTNEEAECYYDLNACNFDLKNRTSMTSLFSTKHQTEWIKGKMYYIKCADILGNVNPDCAIKLMAR